MVDVMISALYIFEVKTVGAETGSGTMLPPKDVNILCTHMHLPSIGKKLNPGDSSHLASNHISLYSFPNGAHCSFMADKRMIRS